MREELYSIFGGAALVASLLIASRGARKRAHFWLWAVACFVGFSALHLLLTFLLLPPAEEVAARGAAELAFLFVSAGLTAWAICADGPDAALFYANIGLCTLGAARQLFRLVFAVWSYAAEWWNLPVFLVCCALFLAALYGGVRRNPFSAPGSASALLFAVLILAASFFFESVCPRVIGGERVLQMLLALSAGSVFVLLALLQGALAALRAAVRERDSLRETQARESALRAREQESAELINIRSHDLKYRLLREKQGVQAQSGAQPPAPNGGGAGEQGTADGALRDALDVYERTFRTGCAALDVILTETGLLCRDRKIDFSCMADGALLAHVDEADLYTLFGNILDNAVEAASKVEQPERRAVTLRVEERHGFAVIREENYFAGKLSFAGGLPRTTKRGGLHGYGLRSVRKTAERYGGSFVCSAEKDRFCVRIALPLRGRDTASD